MLQENCSFLLDLHFMYFFSLLRSDKACNFHQLQQATYERGCKFSSVEGETSCAESLPHCLCSSPCRGSFWKPRLRSQAWDPHQLKTSLSALVFRTCWPQCPRKVLFSGSSEASGRKEAVRQLWPEFMGTDLSRTGGSKQFP